MDITVCCHDNVTTKKENSSVPVMMFKRGTMIKLTCTGRSEQANHHSPAVKDSLVKLVDFPFV